MRRVLFIIVGFLFLSQSYAGFTGGGINERFNDGIVNAVKIIEYGHHKIHKSSSFLCDILGTDTLSLAFKVPTGTKKIHMIFRWAAESKATFEFWEGRTWTAESGTLNPIYNRDRNSSISSIILEDDTSGSFQATDNMVLTPTLQGNGTEIHHEQTWSDKKQTVLSRGASEFILKNDETYVALLTSNDGVKGTHVVLNWYEHTDSN